jgi:hypothetical protein
MWGEEHNSDRDSFFGKRPILEADGVPSVADKDSDVAQTGDRRIVDHSGTGIEPTQCPISVIIRPGKSAGKYHTIR